MRVIVTGSREYTGRDLVRDALDALLAEHGALTVVHGKCGTGADRYAHEWAVERRAAGERRVEVDLFPAQWARHGRAAGPIRNKQMIESGADLVLAFFEIGAGNQGTRDCVRRAEVAGIPVRRWPQRFGAVLW